MEFQIPWDPAVSHQFTKFAAVNSLIPRSHSLPPTLGDSKYIYFGSFHYIPYVLSFYFNLIICFSLDILYSPIFQCNNPLFSYVQSVLKPIYCILNFIIFFNARIYSFLKYQLHEEIFASSILLYMLITVIILKSISDCVHLLNCFYCLFLSYSCSWQGCIFIESQPFVYEKF